MPKYHRNYFAPKIIITKISIFIMHHRLRNVCFRRINCRTCFVSPPPKKTGIRSSHANQTRSIQFGSFHDTTFLFRLRIFNATSHHHQLLYTHSHIARSRTWLIFRDSRQNIYKYKHTEITSTNSENPFAYLLKSGRFCVGSVFFSGLLFVFVCG